MVGAGDIAHGLLVVRSCVALAWPAGYQGRQLLETIPADAARQGIVEHNDIALRNSKSMHPTMARDYGPICSRCPNRVQ